jgi:flagellar protein FliL
MTDVTEIAETGAPAPEKSGRKKLIVIGAAVIGLLAAAGAGAFVFLGNSSAATPATDGATAAAPAREVFFYDLPVITVNLNTGGGPVEFLKLTISLEVPDQTMISTIEPRMPRVLDAFQVYLRELRRSDLEGSAGVYRIKEELQRRINIAVYPAVVDDILFREILVQ